MSIVTLTDVSHAYGHHPLLNRVNLQIATGERISLVGRNGAGKSTLFRIINGGVHPDDGEVWRRDTLRISYLEQDVPREIDDSVYDVVAAGIGDLGSLLSEFHAASRDADRSDSAALRRLSELQHRIDVADGWNTDQRVSTALSRLSLPADQHFAECSGGVRRRVMLAQALVSDPDLLLLDEPTNHMDIAAVTWLEDFLLAYHGALLFITHDRTLLNRLATRIVELDRGTLSSFSGGFLEYRRRKDALLEAKSRAQAKFDKKLAEHEAWIRQGIQARRTRNQGRVKTLHAMRRARSERMAQQGRARIGVDAGELSGKLAVDVHNVSFRYGDRWIVRNFSTRILRGDRVGIIGPNGSGKSTLLKLLVGEMPPEEGKISLGTRLQLAYFDQQRERLQLDKSVRDNVSDGSDYVRVRGRSRHVIGYLKQFLFPPERIDSPVNSLSGGERNRLLLAKLFTHPANMMVLDEPTNDLDVETLELLEELLLDYEGTLLLVSHDRTFIDNTVTSVLVFEGDGKVGEYVGGYDDWIRRSGSVMQVKNASAAKKPTKEGHRHRRAGPDPAQKRKLSYKETRELEALPGQIEALEQEQQQLTQRAGQHQLYKQDKDTIALTVSRLREIHEELERAYARWEQLDARMPRKY